MSRAQACKMLIISEKPPWKLVETKGLMCMPCSASGMFKCIHVFFIRNRGFKLQDTGCWYSFGMSTFQFCLAELVSIFSLSTFISAAGILTEMSHIYFCHLHVYRACRFMQLLETHVIKHSHLSWRFETVKSQIYYQWNKHKPLKNALISSEVFSGTVLLFFTGDILEPCIGFLLAMQQGLGGEGQKRWLELLRDKLVNWFLKQREIKEAWPFWLLLVSDYTFCQTSNVRFQRVWALGHITFLCT